MNAVMVDTNLLVYLYDRHAPAKQELALQVLERLQRTGAGRLSVQCLAEFANAAIRGREPLLTVAEAEASVGNYLSSWRVYDLTPATVALALRGVRQYRLNYWDAQIWAVARLHQLEAVFSEDFNPGALLEGVRFVNPFAPDFDINAWA